MTSDPYSIFAQVKRCLLCAHSLSPHEVDNNAGAKVGICQVCSDMGAVWGNATVHLVLSGEFAGMHTKAVFMASLNPETYRVVYHQDGTLLKIFGADQDEEYEDWLMMSHNFGYEVKEESAFAWPLGTEVEVWHKYRYLGTFAVLLRNGRRRLVEIPNVEPAGTAHHVHSDFPESEPHLRYRRFLDPNWQISLRERVRIWKLEEPDEQEFAVEAAGLYRIDGWLISPEFKALCYDYWRRIG